jgi:hypothetical protein
MPNTMKSKQEIEELLKEGRIVDCHFGDVSLKGLTIEKNANLYYLDVESDLFYGNPTAWIEVMDPAKSKRLF